MLYVIHALDAAGAAERRSRARPQHVERVMELHRQGRMALVGPMPLIDAPSTEGGVAGSLILAEFDSLDAARARIDADPYPHAGAFLLSRVRQPETVCA